jgi:hypothetical protein
VVGILTPETDETDSTLILRKPVNIQKSTQLQHFTDLNLLHKIPLFSENKLHLVFVGGGGGK